MEQNIEKLTAQVLRLESMLKGKASGPGVRFKADTSSDETLAALIGQVQHLEAQLHNFESNVENEVRRRLASKNNPDGGKRKFLKFNTCTECEKAKKKCTHCRGCGESGHRESDCEKNH